MTRKHTKLVATIEESLFTKAAQLEEMQAQVTVQITEKNKQFQQIKDLTKAVHTKTVELKQTQAQVILLSEEINQQSQKNEELTNSVTEKETEVAEIQQSIRINNNRIHKSDADHKDLQLQHRVALQRHEQHHMLLCELKGKLGQASAFYQKLNLKNLVFNSQTLEQTNANPGWESQSRPVQQMKKDVQQFIDYLDDAMHLLDGYPASNQPTLNNQMTDIPPEHFDLAFFEKWPEFYESEAHQKPPVRIIQHLSCTGGTLISKCVAAMPNVSILSEISPLSQLHIGLNPKFSPTDLVYLAAHGKFPLMDELSEKIFKADVDVITTHSKQLGKYLVIREHCHSTYLVGELPEEYKTVRTFLKDEYRILATLTVRHPVDSYLSLVNNGWTHFNPPTIDEYCKRYLLFIEHNDALSIYKYEDFVNDPKKEMKLLCETLELPFNEDFQVVFELNKISGDSGRSSNTIEKRTRREIDEKLRNELNESANYIQLCERLNYEPSVDQVN